MKSRWMLGLAMSVAGGLVLMHGQAWAQSAFPAPLPNAAPANNAASPFPPVNGAPQSSPSAFPPPQSQFPAPGQTSFPSSGTAPVMGGGFSMPQQQAQEPPCMKDFVPLRDERDRRGKLVMEANKHKAPPDEACKLIGNFSQAEEKMVKFMEVNGKSCGIPGDLIGQMKSGHAKTTQLLKRVCDAASQRQAGPAAPSLAEALGGGSLPDPTPTKRSGGSTFDTISGNVLSR